MAAVTRDLVLDAAAPTDERALCAWFDVELAAHAADRPDDAPACWTVHRVRRLSPPLAGEMDRAWLARARGDVVGVAVLGRLTERYARAWSDTGGPPHAR